MVFYWLLPNKIVIQVLWSLFITFHFFVDSENNLEWNKYDAWCVSFAFFFLFLIQQELAHVRFFSFQVSHFFFRLTFKTSIIFVFNFLNFIFNSVFSFLSTKNCR